MKQPAPGVVITGKYRLERALASGGMGSVWVARHVELGVPVAVKFIGAELASSADGRMRFEREAKAAALLQSPYVVSVQDYGVDDDLPYIVMELMRGEDLEDRLRKQGRLSPQETWQMASQIAKGLRRAHEMGIIHRDLKPRNLFIAQNDEEEIVKILDFGIAKALSHAFVTETTATGNVMGSPLYMSPEQVRGAKDIDFRTDLWSFGVVLFRMMTGSLPFVGEVVGDVIAKIIADPIPLATRLVPDLPPAIDSFFERALSRDRTGRFQSAREMVDALGNIVRSAAVPATTATPAVPLSSLATAATERMSSEPPFTRVSDAPPEANAVGTTRNEAMVSTIPLPKVAPLGSASTPPSIPIAKERPSRSDVRKKASIGAVVALLVAVGIPLVALRPREPVNDPSVGSSAAPTAPLLATMQRPEPAGAPDISAERAAAIAPIVSPATTAEAPPTSAPSRVGGAPSTSASSKASPGKPPPPPEVTPEVTPAAPPTTPPALATPTAPPPQKTAFVPNPTVPVAEPAKPAPPASTRRGLGF